MKNLKEIINSLPLERKQQVMKRYGELENEYIQFRYNRYKKYLQSKCDVQFAEYNKGVLHALYGCI